MYPNNLNDIILKCLSDDEIIRSNAYAQLCHLENESNFAYQLFQLYINSSDYIKQVALLACINALSRNIYKSDLSGFKSNLPNLIFKFNITRHNLAEAKHLSVLMRKIVRYEYPQKWPELLNLQIESLQNVSNMLNNVEETCNSIICNLSSVKTCVFLSNYVIKEQVSKRLLRDRNEMYKITQALFPLVSGIWYKFNDHLSQISIAAQNNYGDNANLELINSMYQTSSLMDSLLLRLLYYGKRTPYLDGTIITLISAILNKTINLFKLKFQCEFLYKNIQKLLKFITHLIEHEPLLFALIDLDTFLFSLVNYLTVINGSDYYEHTSTINNGLALINGIFGSFVFNQEPTGHDFIVNIEDINPSVYSDSIKILKNQCSLRLQLHFRNGGLTKYILWLLNNFIILKERDLEVWNNEMSESFSSLDYLPQSIISNNAASIITSICSFKQNVCHVTNIVASEIAKCSLDNHLHLEAILHLISSSVKMIAKHFEHHKMLDILQQILLNETPLYLKLRSLNVLNNIVKNYIYSEEQGLVVLNILILCLSYSGPMHQVVRIACLSPVYNFYVKTNECYYWQAIDASGMDPSSRIIQLVMNLFTTVTYPMVRTKCMNLVCKLATELDVYNSDSSTYQFANLLENILDIYKQSNWEVRESILHLSLSLINSFDSYKCYISSMNNLWIYKFVVEVVLNTMDFTMSVGNRFIKHAEYQELFHSVWVSLLRILPNKLVNIDFIVIDKIFSVFDKIITKNYDFVNQPSHFHDVVLEYLSLTVCLFEECALNPNNQITMVAQRIQLSHLFSLIVKLVSNNILVNKLLVLVYFMPSCELTEFHQFPQQLIVNLWRDMYTTDRYTTTINADSCSTMELFLPPIVSYYNRSPDIFDKFLANIVSGMGNPKERLVCLLNFIEKERSRDTRLYGCLIAQKITKIIAKIYPTLVDHQQIIAKLGESVKILMGMYKECEGAGKTFISKQCTYSIGNRTSRSDIDDIKMPISYRVHNLMDRLYINIMEKVI